MYVQIGDIGLFCFLLPNHVIYMKIKALGHYLLSFVTEIIGSTNTCWEEYKTDGTRVIF
jgi:hypothetical protein